LLKQKIIQNVALSFGHSIFSTIGEELPKSKQILAAKE
jgi:hypothetical protein